MLPSNPGARVMEPDDSSQSILRQVRMVLVEPTHPGNIGAAARAMKTMGLSQLALVAPKHFPSAEATARASGADDLLHLAGIHETLDEAISDCGTVFGTTARSRRFETRILDPKACADHAIARLRGSPRRLPVAIVFGREHSGLSNDELDRCHALVRIPTAANFSSLNIAAAVQIIAYEMSGAAVPSAEVASLGDMRAKIDPDPRLAGGGAADIASASELQGFYRHLESALIEIGYLDPQVPKLLMRRLRRLFNRAQPEVSEINILRGILSAAERAALSPSSSSSAESSPDSGSAKPSTCVDADVVAARVVGAGEEPRPERGCEENLRD
ncbi:RNA methyltransferase [Thioalkalivibrio sp. HK1]|uniref:RNA methyltransferase n=1 Tax=Thioalkalivibrio sp. HK1 TaxID=1469245 RepID=UPI0027D1F6CA|nr:RNA methyltransferase [Thioalkalivibrio sp. HK1]